MNARWQDNRARTQRSICESMHFKFLGPFQTIVVFVQILNANTTKLEFDQSKELKTSNRLKNTIWQKINAKIESKNVPYWITARRTIFL